MKAKHIATLLLLGGFSVAAFAATQIRETVAGYLIGTTTDQLVGFHGATPVAQRSGSAQTALTDSTGGSTANTTLAAVTAPSAITDSSGGSASTTLAAVTDASAAVTDTTAASLASVNTTIGIIKNAEASIAARQAEDRAAIVALTNAAAKEARLLNELRASLVEKGLIKGGS